MNVNSMTSSAFVRSLPSSLEEVGRMKNGYLVVNAKAGMIGWTTTRGLASSASDIGGFVREHHAQMSLRTLQTIKLYAEEAHSYREASSWGEMLQNVIAKIVELVSHLRGKWTEQEIYRAIFFGVDKKMKMKEREFEEKCQINFNVTFEKEFNRRLDVLNHKHAQIEARRFPVDSSRLDKIKKQEARLHREMTETQRVFLTPDEGDPVRP